MSQPRLFDDAADGPGAYGFARSRTKDPETSKAAAMRSAHRAGTQRAQVAAAVARHPGLTSAELAQAASIRYHDVARRLPECERLGSVRRGPKRVCAVGGAEALTWFPSTAAATIAGRDT